MKTIGITSVAILSATLIACGSRAPKTEVVETIDSVVINDQNTVTHDLASALSRAELIVDAAPVEDLVARSVVEYDAHEANQRLTAAKDLLAKSANIPLPGDKDAAKRFTDQTSQQLNEAIAESKTLDDTLLKEEIPSAKLSQQAKSLQDHIRHAAEDHAALMRNIDSEQQIDMVVWEDILPQHELAANLAAAIHHAETTLANDNKSTSSKAVWTREAALMDTRLNRAEHALSAIEKKLKPEAIPLVSEIRTHHQAAQADLGALNAELAKKRPNFDKARGFAKSAEDEILKAQSVHRDMIEKAHLGPFPKYDYND